MKVNYGTLLLIFLSVLLPTMAHAYVGPGAGLSAIGTIIAFIVAIFLLILGFLWYPIKRLLKSRQINSARDVGNEDSVTKTHVDKNDNLTR